MRNTMFLVFSEQNFPIVYRSLEKQRNNEANSYKGETSESHIIK